tara:strand:- start:4089 stop:4763 length:675 start_codon:yes stop_codon:yes gene_type:complete
MLSTSGMKAGSGKEKPVIGPGNQVVKINSITFDVTPYAADAYNIILHVESEPMEGDFQGFLVDPNNPNSPRYAGQVGRVRFSQYAYKDAILPNGNEISRDTEVMKAMIFLSEQIGKRTELDAIQANTIEEFMTKCNSVLSGPTFLNVCLGTREWENKEGYINDDLYLPKLSKAGIPLEALGVENSRLITYNINDKNHYRPVVKKDVPTTNAFEPAQAAGDDFDL